MGLLRKPAGSAEGRVACCLERDIDGTNNRTAGRGASELMGLVSLLVGPLAALSVQSKTPQDHRGEGQTYVHGGNKSPPMSFMQRYRPQSHS